MSLREDLQALLDQSIQDGRSEEYVAGLRDAMQVAARWQRNSGRYANSYGPASNARRQRNRKELNDELIEGSMVRRKRITYAEWLVIMDASLTAQEAARRLGRTYRGVMHARARLARGFVPTPPAKAAAS